VRGWANWAGARAREKEEGLRPARLRAERGERERERKGLSLFFSNFFQIHFSNIQTPNKRKPCIQIMMHKHLLSLNYFSDVLFI
jgi:hypothetical protein